jgi:hypothetical protein
LAFAPWWVLVGCPDGGAVGSEAILSRSVEALHRSLGALLQVDQTCPSRVLAIVEHIVGIYFISIILAGYVSWLAAPKRGGGDHDSRDLRSGDRGMIETSRWKRRPDTVDPRGPKGTK